MYPITTTLNAIRSTLSTDDFNKLLKHLGKTEADDAPLLFSDIARSNGVQDAFWCLESINQDLHRKPIFLLKAEIAERVLHIFEEKYPEDKRPRDNIVATRFYAEGKLTKEELRVFRKPAAAAADEAYVSAAYAASYAAAASAHDSSAVHYAVNAVNAASDAAAARKQESAAQLELLIKYFG